VRESTLLSGRISAGLATLLLVSPLIVFATLSQTDSWNATVRAPAAHFYVVSATTLVAACISVALMVSVQSVRTTRNLFLALGFLALAMIFATHGLSTPGFIVSAKERPYAVIVSAGLSEFVGAAFILLSVLPEWSKVGRLTEKHGNLVLPAAFVVLLGYGVVAMLWPDTLSLLPESPTWDTGLALATVVMLGTAAWKYWRAWQLTRFPGQFAMVTALVLLMESQVSMSYGTLWRLNWWEYHALMLTAFLVLVAGWGVEAFRAKSLLLFSRAIALRDALDRVSLANPDTLDALEVAMAEKDEYTRQHMGRVAELSVAIARQMRLSPETCLVVEVAGRIHDIGKISVPDAVLLKPGKLTAEEFDLMKLHSTSGERIARASKVLAHVALVIRTHHEHYAGAGYPDGRSAEAIPLEARIVAVADAFDAMTSPRVYRAPRGAAAALEEIERCGGTQFDPRCVVAFRAWLEAEGMLEDEADAEAA
jgi:HD-GYP domain-containing protein (c-di-GMP phosphodiesterase class II)